MNPFDAEPFPIVESPWHERYRGLVEIDPLGFDVLGNRERKLELRGHMTPEQYAWEYRRFATYVGFTDNLLLYHDLK